MREARLRCCCEREVSWKERFELKVVVEMWKWHWSEWSFIYRIF
jgi:hypothetical protein